MDEITLLRPLWLLVIPILIWVGYRLRQKAGVPGDWGQVMAPQMMAAMQALGRVQASARQSRFGPPSLWLAGIVMLALAGPALQKRDALAFRNLDGVIFVVDASPSVLEDPLWQQALTAARISLSGLGAKPAALVVYAGDAYTASALTSDTGQIGLTLSLIEPGLVPDEGSRPHLALSRAADILTEAKIIAGDVVLLSDGAGTGPEALAEAARIAGAGARLSILHLPGSTGDGQASRAEMEALAAVGDGAVFSLGEAETLADQLAVSGLNRMEQQDLLLLYWADYGRWLLVLALIPALLLTRKGAI